MLDMTVLFYTANLIPAALMEASIENLKKVVGNSPIVSVSQKPMNLGTNICVGNIGQHAWNIYWQMLVGAKETKTKYIATAEDDILYSYEHFHTQYPKKSEFLYDKNRWMIFTWKKPMFSKKTRAINGMMLCEREPLIEALEERFIKYPTKESIDSHVFGEIGRTDRAIGVKTRECGVFEAAVPSIMVNHEYSLTYIRLGSRKESGTTPTDRLESWGTADTLLRTVMTGH